MDINGDYIWFGTTQGLLRYNPKTGEKWTVRPKKHGLPEDRIQWLDAETDQVWIQLYRDYRRQYPVLWRLTVSSVQWRQVAESIGGSFFAADDQFLWEKVNNKDFFIRIDKKSGAQKNIPLPLLENYGAFFLIPREANNFLWLASNRVNNLYKYKKRTGQWQTLPLERKKETLSERQFYVYSFWLGVKHLYFQTNIGLLKAPRKHPSEWQLISPRQGNVEEVIEDENDLWVLQHQTVYKYNHILDKWVAYSRLRGIGTAMRLYDGQIWVGTGKGIYVIDKAKYRMREVETLQDDVFLTQRP